MQRYFVPPERLGPDSVRIEGDDAHHLIRVMRAQEGDKFLCASGTGRVVLVAVRSVEKTAVEAEILEELAETNEPSVEVWVAQSLPKGDKLETVIQKCTEIGAARFLPFESERTVVQYDARKETKRLERWRKIAKEAAEQAHRSRIPAVDSPLAWQQLLPLAGQADVAFICYEKEEALSLRRLLREGLKDCPGKARPAEATGAESPPGGLRSADISEGPPAAKRRTLLLVIGPEGGFTEKEAAEAEAAGCRSVSLGKRILRTETAALVALSCVMYESGEMGE